MSSPMSPPISPIPGAAPGAAPGGAQSSVLNPQDSLRNAARGRIRPDMTVREGLEMMGIDVDGPISQLPGALKGQLQNATTEGKIQSAAASQPAGGPPTGGLGGLLGAR